LPTRPTAALFARFWRVSLVNPIHRPLQPAAHQRVGRLENGGADQQFQFLHPRAVRSLAGQTRHPLLDFPFLGQEDMGRAVFFLKPAAISSRVFCTIRWTYCSARLSKRC